MMGMAIAHLSAGAGLRAATGYAARFIVDAMKPRDAVRLQRDMRQPKMQACQKRDAVARHIREAAEI